MTASPQNIFTKNSPTANNPAVISGGETLSYSEFFRCILGVEHHVRTSGIAQHNRVGIRSHNSIEYLVALFALWRLGAVACLLNTRLPDNTVDQQLKSINSQRLLTSTDLAAISERLRNARAEDAQDLCVPFNQEATVIFTSGTSCEPKAVLHTFGNHYYNAKGANEHLPVVPGDQWLLSLPLYHVGGLGIIFRSFLGGGSVVIPGPDEPIDEVLKTQKITHLSLVPTQLMRLLRNTDCHSALTGLKVILLGGGPIPDSLIEEAVELGLPVYTTYGSTEMASQVATSSRLTKDNLISAGKVLNYRRLMLTEGEEILVKGEALFKGYIKHSDLSLPFNTNGYFLTGDLGEFRDDGTLVVKGRKDNMFISGGENIQPEEIEQYLCRMQHIERAVVLPAPDDEFGARPVAVIKTKEGDALMIPEMSAFLTGHLPKFKVPKQYFTWPDTVDIHTPKVNRQELSQTILSIKTDHS